MGRVPSIRLVLRWAADPVVRAHPEDGLVLEHAQDLAVLRVRDLVVLDRELPVEHRRQLKRDVRSALHRAAVLVGSSSIRRPKKVR